MAKVKTGPGRRTTPDEMLLDAYAALDSTHLVIIARRDFDKLVALADDSGVDQTEVNFIEIRPRRK